MFAVICADHSATGSVLLAMLFRESARKFSEDYYRNASNAQLQELHNTFKAYVPDDYKQVPCLAMLKAFCFNHADLTAGSTIDELDVCTVACDH